MDDLLDVNSAPYKEEIKKITSIEGLSRSEVLDNLMELRVLIKKRDES